MTFTEAWIFSSKIVCIIGAAIVFFWFVFCWLPHWLFGQSYDDHEDFLDQMAVVQVWTRQQIIQQQGKYRRAAAEALCLSLEVS